MKVRALLTIAALTFVATISTAQQHENIAKGFAPDKIFHFDNLDQINLFNLSLNVGIPIGPPMQVDGGLSYNVTLRYSGNNWSTEVREVSEESTPGHFVTRQYYSTHPYQYANEGPVWNAGLGWNVGFGQLIQPGVDPSVAWIYESEDGAKHHFFDTLHEPNTNETPYTAALDQYGQSIVQYSSDGSYLRMSVVYVQGVPYRDIEFADGTVRRFPYFGGNPIHIRDKFGNLIEFITDYPVDPSTPRLTISNRYCPAGQPCRVRAVHVNYEVIPVAYRTYGAGYYTVVKSIDFPKFGGGIDVYTLHYGVTATSVSDQVVSYAPGAPDGAANISRNLPHTGQLDCTVSPTTQAPVLTSVTRPDGSSFEMRYDLGDNGVSYSQGGGDTADGSSIATYTVCTDSAPQSAIPGFSGNLKSLTLPTLGTIEWDYARYAYPSEGATSHQRIETDPNATTFSHTPVEKSVGVRERRLRSADGTLASKRTYVSRYYRAVPTNDAAYGLLTTVKDWTNLATTPTVFSRQVHYFSVGITAGVGMAKTGEYGLPFTRRDFGGQTGNPDPETDASALGRYNEQDPVVAVVNPDPTDASRHISSKTYDSNGKLLQYTYVGYEADDVDMTEGQQGNRRETSRRVVWNDGNNGYLHDDISVSTDFDGFGHYRKTVETETTEVVPVPGRESVTQFNRPDADVGGDVPDSGQYRSDDPSRTPLNGGFRMLPRTSPWLLNLYTKQTVAEAGVTATTLACFDAFSGFLTRRRVLSGGAPAPTDLLTVVSDDGHGNVATEKFYGGDRGGLSTSPLCSMGLPSAAGFLIAHAYDWGTPARTWYLDDATQTPASFWLQYDVIDFDTGLVASSYDSAGLATTFDYDALRRLKTTTPPGGEIPTQYTYTNASGSAPAKVNIMRDGGAGRRPEVEFHFDSFGRVKLERERNAADTFNQRESRYDDVGNRVFVSEWGVALPSKGTTTTYDAFGRPRSVNTADNKTASITYSGSRTKVRSVQVQTSATLGESLQSTTEIYDRFGRLTAVREPSSLTGTIETTYTYDVGNRLSKAVTKDVSTNTTQTREFVSDHRGLLLLTRSPEKVGDSIYSDYDARGHARRIRDGATDLTYTYDFLERLEWLENTGGGTVKAFTFGTSNIPANCTTSCTEYLNGRLLSATRTQVDSALGGSIDVTETYHYNRPGGRLGDRQTAITSTATFTGATFNTSQTYDQFGAPQIIGYPKCLAPTDCGAATPTRSSDHAYYDYANGWMTFVGGDGPAYASMTYQPNGLVDTVTHANGISETWAPDPNGMARPCAIYATGKGAQLVNDGSAPCGRAMTGATSGVQWSTGTYAYDGSGNIRQIGSRRFVYDGVSRLVNETDAGTTATATYRNSTDYKYDVFGNMTERALSLQTASTLPNGDGFVSRTRMPIPVDAATNRLLTAAYDAAGNMTVNGTDASASTYTWDSVGTMRSLTESARELHFLYTADDERVAIVNVAAPASPPKAATTWTLRGYASHVLRTLTDDYTSGTHIWSWAGDEIYRGSTLLADVTVTGTRHFVLDHLGSPRLITDESTSGNPQTVDFSAFGSGGMVGAGPLQFTGHERDSTTEAARTLDYMHARYYSAAACRFLAVDAQSGTPARPQTWNRYSYAGNNPVRRIDPDGKVAVTVTGGEIPDEQGSPMFLLAERLNGRTQLGAVKGFGNRSISTATAFIVSEYAKDPKQPVVLIGHSWGGAAVLTIARQLQALHIPVAKLVTLDVVSFGVRLFGGGHDLAVPGNVASAINLFQTTGPLGNNRLVPAAGSSTSVQNVQIKNTTHTDMDNLLWTALSSALSQMYGSEPPAAPQHRGYMIRPGSSGDSTASWLVYYNGVPVN